MLARQAAWYPAVEMLLPPQPARSSRLARLRGLYAIVGGADPVAQAAEALAGGASVIQLRVKDAPAGEVLELAARLVALARGRALVIVNDRADLAVLAGADGVHVGDEDLPVAAARAVVGPDLLVGRSTRTLDGRAARRWPRAPTTSASARSSPPPPSGSTRPPRGLAMLAEVASRLPAPVVAIGGIGLEHHRAGGRRRRRRRRRHRRALRPRGAAPPGRGAGRRLRGGAGAA